MEGVKIISVTDLLSKEFDEYLRRKHILTEYLRETMSYHLQRPNFDNETFDIYTYLSGDNMQDAFIYKNSEKGYKYWEAYFLDWTNLRSNILIKLN